MASYAEDTGSRRDAIREIVRTIQANIEYRIESGIQLTELP